MCIFFLPSSQEHKAFCLGLLLHLFFFFSKFLLHFFGTANAPYFLVVLHHSGRYPVTVILTKRSSQNPNAMRQQEATEENKEVECWWLGWGEIWGAGSEEIFGGERFHPFLIRMEKSGGSTATTSSREPKNDPLWRKVAKDLFPTVFSDCCRITCTEGIVEGIKPTTINRQPSLNMALAVDTCCRRKQSCPLFLLYHSVLML